MRKLIVQRENGLYAFFMKFTVYIEDENSNDILIEGVKCRKLGEIKNKETKAFEIDDKEREVFIVHEKEIYKKNNEFLTIPAGTEDVTICGKTYFDIVGKNPFRLNGITGKELLKRRKIHTALSYVIPFLALFIGIIIGIVLKNM